MNRLIAVLLSIFSLLTSCNNDEGDKSPDLIGTWHGVRHITQSLQNGETTFNGAPYFVAFAYDNGVVIQTNGKLTGRCATADVNNQSSIWQDCYQDYGGKWTLSNELLTLNDVEYNVVSFTSNELVIWRQVNSGLSIELTLEKQ